MKLLTTTLLSAIVGSVAAIITNWLALKHRLQSENEYSILLRIWGKAYLLKSRANSLRPKLDTASPGEPGEKQKRLDAFARAKKQYDQEMYLNKPFYPDGIHQFLKELRDNASFEAIDFSHQTATAENSSYWAAGEASAKKINALVDQLCDAIRCRIHGRVWYRALQVVAAIRSWLYSSITAVVRPFRSGRRLQLDK